MKQRPYKIRFRIASLVTLGLLIVSCGGGGGSSSSNPPIAAAPNSYDVTLVNTTNNQPLSPVLVVIHAADYSAWAVGNAASVDIEYIAEQGSNSQLRDSLAAVDATSTSAVGLLEPGTSQTITVTAGAASQTRITLAAMLINTNDAFSGVNAIDVSALERGGSMRLYANVYDAGTELNSESANTIPGPGGANGEGFNSARTDINNVVRIHAGVVTADDGLTNSILDQSYRFDNPGMIVTITRK